LYYFGGPICEILSIQMFVKDFLTRDLIRVVKQETIERVAYLFSTLGISCIWIVNEHDIIIGMATKTDIVSAYVLGKNVMDQIGSIMCREIQYVDQEYSREKCVEIMKRKNIHHVLVRDTSSQHVIGMVSTVDILRDIVTITGECPYIQSINTTRRNIENEMRREITKIATDYQWGIVGIL
jgi:predicted transcriptional regulator